MGGHHRVIAAATWIGAMTPGIGAFEAGIRALVCRTVGVAAGTAGRYRATSELAWSSGCRYSRPAMVHGRELSAVIVRGRLMLALH